MNNMKKIILVEDEELLSNILKRKLTQEHYDVAIAKNGEDGLKLAREAKPDLVLLDIVMPKMGGFEFMAEMQKDPALKNIPIVVISNSGQPLEIEKMVKLGAKDWVIKADIDPQEVINKIKKQIG